MEKEAVPQCPLYPPGSSQKEVSPDIPKAANAQGEEKDLQSIENELGRRDAARGKIVNGIFDDPRNEELENIDDKEGDQSRKESPTVLPKIILKGLIGSHRNLLPF